MIKKILLICLLFGLINCSARKEKVLVKTPMTFRSMTKAYQSQANFPCDAWWLQFQDKELNRLIVLGLKHNNDIGIALGNLKQARGQLLALKLSWVPTIQFLAGYSTNPALGVPGAFYGIWPYYVVNIMKLYQQNKQAMFDVAYQRAAVDGVRLAVIGQIASAYFTLLAQKEQMRLLEQLEHDLQTLIDLSQKDIRIGLENEITLAQLTSDWSLVAAQVEPVKHNLVLSENALRFLINENPGAIVIGKSFSQLDFSHFKPGSLPATVLNNRPDMKMAIAALNSAKMNKNVAWSNFFPSLQLDQFVGRVHRPKSRTVSLTDAYADMDWMLSTFGVIKSAQGFEQTAKAALFKTVRQILREVDNDYSANRRMQAQFNRYQQAEKEYRHKYQLQKELLKTGLISYKELLKIKIYLDNLALQTNQAKLELAMSLAVLYQDLAGGYAYDIHSVSG